MSDPHFDPAKENAPLIEAIGAFCARHGLARTRFGELALNDTRFVGDLESGRVPSARTKHRIRLFMDRYEETTAGAA